MIENALSKINRRRIRIVVAVLSLFIVGAVVCWVLSNSATRVRWVSLPKGTKGVDGFTVLPDGKSVLLACGDGTVRKFDLATFQVTTLFSSNARILAIDVSPDGQRIAGGGADHSINIWSVPNYTLVATLQQHSEVVRGVKFSPDGNWLASCARADPNICVWNTQTNELACQFTSDSDGSLSLCWGDKGDVYWGGQNGKVWTGNRERPQEVRLLSTSHSMIGSILKCGPSMLVWTFDGGATAWNLNLMQLIREFSGAGWLTTASYHAPSHLLACGANTGIVSAWDLNSGELKGQLNTHPQSISRVEFLDDGRLMIAFGGGTLDDSESDGGIAVWNVPK